MRVYELAKKLDISNKDLIEKLKALGCQVTSHMSIIQDQVLEEFIKPKNKEIKAEPVKTTMEKTKNDTQTNKSYLQDSESSLPLEISDPYEDENLNLSESPILPSEDLLETAFSTSGRGGRGLSNNFDGGRRPGGRRRKARKAQRRFSSDRTNAQPIDEITSVEIAKDLILSDVAKMTGKAVSEVVLAFLKKGRAYSVNQLIPKAEIVDICKVFGLEVTESDVSSGSSKKWAETELRQAEKDSSKFVLRSPIVVVMGHVDHGKTTLLDYIRKTSVAAGESGGITQKISAYQVKTKAGEIVFIDTPGHEAFSLMRRCGAKITDIVLIVIAADDGIMPQTEEAISLAKQSGAQIIIALNKTDKEGLEKNIEMIKTQLSKKYDILIEEWGGQTICLPISAKTGKGVDDLLEMVALQAEIMNLKALKTGPASGFILESNFQRGYGPVSSVIITEGELNLGDNFLCGETVGKVRLLEDYNGKPIKSAGPSSLVKVVGFSSLSEPGQILKVHGSKEILKLKSTKKISQASGGRIVCATSSVDLSDKKSEVGKVKIYIKVGTGGSLDALIKAIDRLKSKNQDVEKRLVVCGASVGDVSCNDIILAEDNEAIIMLFASGVEHKALGMASEKGVKIERFSIIYKLIETIEEMVKKESDKETVYREVGRATVIKVFNIKGRGVIAGSKVIEGKVVKNGRVICLRDNEKIAEGDISSLQHLKKTVPEVKKGFECGLICENYSGWQEGDTVICLEPTKRGAL